jgi:toxin ParE1/3/4
MRVFFTDEALADIDQIHEYYREVAPLIADKLILKIIDKTLQLEQYSLSGPTEPILSEFGISRRFLVEGNYKIVYQVIDGLVYITQVFDARQNPPKMVKGNK